ncbi:MAG: type I-E CRISPR-associated protein Cas7/Cse4/CasC [Salinisphaeraceae bacterium]|jgi:CRISPR system Cascade subunit CasC|nr:type I-E CRISPR-associated protein Cas7/Cse4/CasC [Salinisphaeraceae bacterium]
MKRFLQLHLLTSYPPSNVNRDDLGRPKTAVMGGANRLRISSQSLKRAWRTSDVFQQGLDGHLGTRTKQMGVKIFQDLTNAGVKESDAKKWAKDIAGQFGKLKSGKAKADDEEAVSDMPELEIEQLAHFSPEELRLIDELVAALAQRGGAPEEGELELLRKQQSAADIALFGRMLASVPKFNIEAAAQVAHAITVHKVAVENDYFTAVDDLNTGEVDRGAAHIGETEFGAGLFYLYICVDRSLLVENLGGDEALARKALAGLTEAVAKVAPKGKRNSFGSTAHAIYVLAETGDQQPRSLSVSFLKPVYGESVAEHAIGNLETMRANMDSAYDGCADAHRVMNVPAGQGSLREIIEFVQE